MRQSHAGEMTVPRGNNFNNLTRDNFFRDCNVNKHIQLNFDTQTPVIHNSGDFGRPLDTKQSMSSSSRNYAPFNQVTDSLSDSFEDKNGSYQENAFLKMINRHKTQQMQQQVTTKATVNNN